MDPARILEAIRREVHGPPLTRSVAARATVRLCRYFASIFGDTGGSRCCRTGFGGNGGSVRVTPARSRVLRRYEHEHPPGSQFAELAGQTRTTIVISVGEPLAWRRRSMQRYPA